MERVQNGRTDGEKEDGQNAVREEERKGEEGGKRSGHIADRQSKYLPRRNVGIRPLRARVRLFGKAYGGPSKWPLPADGWARRWSVKSTASSSRRYPLPLLRYTLLLLPSTVHVSPRSYTHFRLAFPGELVQLRVSRGYRVITAVYSAGRIL